MVKDWLKITGEIHKPPVEHPKKPIWGFDCPRSEVSMWLALDCVVVLMFDVFVLQLMVLLRWIDSVSVWLPTVVTVTHRGCSTTTWGRGGMSSVILKGKEAK